MAKGKRGPDVPLYKKYALALTAGSLGGIAVLAVLLCLEVDDVLLRIF